jgi:rSAM/selenodomain-associated transferase 2
VVSVIIPTLNEKRALPATLASVIDQMSDAEVVVADGGSSDGTKSIVADLAARHQGIRWLESSRGRAVQMNAGAAEASGDWLLFLHADTILPAGALARIEGQPSTVDAGCFHHRFSGTGPVLRLLSWCHNRRFAVTRVIYGDQAMFVRNRLFRKLGGFPDRDMEDIAFSLVLRGVTRPVMAPETVVTDSRKFESMGPLRATARATRLLIRFRLSRRVEGDDFFGEHR